MYPKWITVFFLLILIDCFLILILCINSLAPMVKDFINMIWTGLLTPSLVHLKISTELETGFLMAEVRDIGISAARRRLLTTLEIQQLERLHALKAKSGKLYLSPKAYQDSRVSVGEDGPSIPSSTSTVPRNEVSERLESPVLSTTAPVGPFFTPLVQPVMPEERPVTSEVLNVIVGVEQEFSSIIPSFSTGNEETIPYRPITTPISPFYEARDTSPATASLLASLFEGIMPTNEDYSFPDLFSDLRAFTERTAGGEFESEPISLLSTAAPDIVQIAVENASETVEIVPETTTPNGVFISPSLELPDSTTSISVIDPSSMDLLAANDLNSRTEIEGISPPVPLITPTSSTSNPPPLYAETPSVSRPGLTVESFPAVSSRSFDGVTSSTSENVPEPEEMMVEEERMREQQGGDTGWSSLLFGGGRGEASSSSLSPSYKKRKEKKEVSRVRKSALRGVTPKKPHKDRAKSKKGGVGPGKVPRQFNKLLHKNVRGTWNLTREEFVKKQRVINHLKKLVDLRGQKVAMSSVDYESFINFVHLLEGPLTKISFVCPCDKNLEQFTPPSPLMNPRYAIYQPQTCKGEMALICITPKRNKALRKTGPMAENEYAIGYGIHKGGKALAMDRNISVFIYARDAEMEQELSERILAHPQYINTKIRFYPFLNRPLQKTAIDPVQSLTLVIALMILFYEGSFCVTSILAKLHHSSTEDLYSLVMGKLEGCLRRTWQMPTNDE